MALRRYPDEAPLGGVCEGIGRELGTEAWIVRLLLVLSVLAYGVGILPYILLWIFVPKEE